MDAERLYRGTCRPSADRFTNADGQAFTVAALVETSAQAAEVGYADTVAAMRGTKPYGRSTLQTYACNGTSRALRALRRASPRLRRKESA